LAERVLNIFFYISVVKVYVMEQHALKCKKKMFEFQHLLLLSDIWWLNILSIFRCCSFLQQQCQLDICVGLRQLFSCIGA